MSKCKWYQRESIYPASKTCDNPIPKLSRIERRKTGREYPEDPNMVMCGECIVNDYFAIPLVLLMASIPLIVLLKLKEE